MIAAPEKASLWRARSGVPGRKVMVDRWWQSWKQEGAMDVIVGGMMKVVKADRREEPHRRREGRCGLQM